MGYLKEFLTQINQRDFNKFLVLWEEYCMSDEVDPEEFNQLLKAIKSSELSKSFGRITETALPLANTIKDESQLYEILSLLIDIQTTNSPLLAEIALETIRKRYGEDPKFNERIRLTGLRNKDNFQGAIAKYDLMAHMAKGNVVFHTGGWGTGEIIDVSPVREHLVIEFENISGRKDISYANAFKTLIPLPSNHFLSRRFSDADRLEEEGKNDPVSLVKLLLRDLGPKTAAEIKDELCDLVIPEEDWTKWWQGARAKMKKDPIIEMPESLKDHFILRKAEITAEERLQKSLQNNPQVNQIILSSYNFVRDNPSALKNPETQSAIQEKLNKLLEQEELTNEQKIQIHLLLDQFFDLKESKNEVANIVVQSSDPVALVKNIEIIAFKKRALLVIKEHRQDWQKVFLNLLFSLPQAQLRDYLFKELNQSETHALLKEHLQALLTNPSTAPDMFVWYFQKLIAKNEDENLPYANKEGREMFFDAFFILYSHLETQPEQRELLKKMYNLLSSKRYALVRELLQDTTLEYTKEVLLLVSKCQTLTDHDKKILRSLAEVVHPSLIPPKTKRGASKSEEEEIWTTEEGYLKTQERIKQIGTVEVVENAREIEAARALGDLRENSEFKFAQERRARLQSELKTLSDQLSKARIITPADIHTDEVGIGSVVKVRDKSGKETTYTLLGSWDADPENNILSLSSKFVQEMVGKKVNETFNFKGETFKILSIVSYLSL